MLSCFPHLLTNPSTDTRFERALASRRTQEAEAWALAESKIRRVARCSKTQPKRGEHPKRNLVQFPRSKRANRTKKQSGYAVVS